MRHELTRPDARALHELRTVQYLEEAVGPAGLRRLAEAMADERTRATLQEVRRTAAVASMELESIIEDWTLAVDRSPRPVRPLPHGGLDATEMIDSFVEVKRSSAEVLRRAANEAPSDALCERLLKLADDEERAALALEALRG